MSQSLSTSKYPFWETALNHIQNLTHEIGPRPAGSENEKKAFKYVENNLSEFGYEMERIPVTYAPPPRFFMLYILGAIVLFIGALNITAFPLGGLLLPIIIVALPQLAMWQTRLRPTTEVSEDLYAFIDKSEEKPLLILCAHVDSAPISRYRSKLLLRIHSLCLFLAQRCAIALAALGILLLMELFVPEAIIIGIIYLTSLISMIWIVLEVFNQIGPPADYSLGVYDNASGIGITLVVAEHFSQQSLRYMRLGFLFTGAEETGLHGATAFARHLCNRKNIYVLNLDMLGTGSKLQYITGDGTIWRVHTDKRMNRILKEIDPTLIPLWHTNRSGDYLPFIQEKIPAISLESGGTMDVDLAYHSYLDTIEIINKSSLQSTTELVVNFINRFQYEVINGV